MTISKIRKIFSIALIPRIIRYEFTLKPKALVKRPIDSLWKANKSTESKDTDAECEKCKKIIDKVFGPDKPETVVKNVEANIDDVQCTDKNKLNENSEVIADTLLTVNTAQKVLETVGKDIQSNVNRPLDKNRLDNIIQYTTAKENKEELAQKLENIDDPILTGAGKPKVEGFNTPPKVLPDHEIPFENKNSLCTKIGPEEDAIDEIAKKCFSTPPDKIDERIIEEMKSCGMLGRGRRRQLSRKSGNNNSNKKETLLESKPDEETLYFDKLKSSIRPLHSYPAIKHRKVNMSQRQENIYKAYFKKVPIDLSGDRNSKITSAISNISTDQDKDIKQLSQAKDQIYEHGAEISKEDLNMKHDLLKTVTDGVENFRNADEKPEFDVENIRLTADERSRLAYTKSVTEQSHGLMKPGVLPCNQIHRTTQPIAVDKSFVVDKREPYVFSSSTFTSDQLEQNVPERPFNNPNTAISGTLPQHDVTTPEYEIKDTAISSKQDPAEYFDWSNCYLENLGEYSLSPSAIKPLEPYHPYTIISQIHMRESENILFSSKEALNIDPQNHIELHCPSAIRPLEAYYPYTITSEMEIGDPENILFSSKETFHVDMLNRIESQGLPQTINKEVSAAMGPLPELRDMEEQLSLSEMLKRVRERNRLQYCQECKFGMEEAEPVEANKCNPPLDKGPGKTLGPGPCKPKDKPACPPPPKCPPPPPPCKPKDPCAKFTKTNLIGDKIKEAFMLVLQIGFKPACAFPAIAPYDCNVNVVEPLKHVFLMEDASRDERQESSPLGNCPQCSKNDDDVILTRDFTPWSPIPSWPIPKKVEKKPFVCPKEGCKYDPPPRLNPPCKENPCMNLPKRSFSAMDLTYELLYLDEDEF